MNISAKTSIVGNRNAHTERTLVRVLASSTEHVGIFGANAGLALPDDASKALPDSIVWMPAGTHEISAHTADGGTYNGKVICDEQSCRAVNASKAKIEASGRRVWLDFNHEEAEASAWIDSFSWDASRGIIASLKWTAPGEAALRGRAFRSFSPAFACEQETGRVRGLLGGDHSAGGLVNSQAFTAMPALIAARMAAIPPHKPAAGGTGSANTMTKEQLIALLAALKVTAPADANVEVLTALHTKTINDLAVAEVNAKAAAEKAKADNAAAVQAAAAKLEKDAADAVAVQAAAAKSKADADEKAKLASELVEIKASLAAMRAGATAAGAGPGIIQVTASVEEALKGYAKHQLSDGKGKGEFYEQNLAPVIAKMGGRRFTELLVAAMPVLAKNVEVQAANSIGTLVGTLVAQQSLALLTYEFPILGMLSTDFSNLSAKWNQTIQTRLKTAITASQYAGTYSANNAGTVDVPVVINHHPYAQVGFTVAELGGTNRDLFGEQAEVVNYALGVDMVNAIYALFVAANFTITPLVLGGTGGGTAGATGVGYARASAVNAAKALFVNLQPRAGRWNLLNANAFGGLGSDAAVVSMASYLKPEIITGYELPKIADMQPIQVVNLPTTLNLCGVAGSPRAIAMATRVPDDYTKALPGASYGNVSQVTDPKTGITFAVTQYVNHDTGTANYRVAVMYGVAVGDPKGAVLTYGA